MTRPNKRNILIEHLSEIGSKGGKATSEAKAIAARINAQAGGRPRKIYVYGLLNLETGRVECVGQTNNVRQRFNKYLSDARRNGRLPDWGRSTQRTRYKRLQFPIGVVILAVTDEEGANDAEKAFFDHYKLYGECEMNHGTFHKCRDRELFATKEKSPSEPHSTE